MIRPYLLDTNMVSYIVKGRSPAASARLLALRDDETVTISVITAAEIQHGLARKPEATALKSLMEGFLASIQVLSWRPDAAEASGRVKARLEKSGSTLGNMDLMIAAHAIVTGAILVTNDKDFLRVDELTATIN